MGHSGRPNRPGCGRLARIWNEHDTTSQKDLPQGAQDTLPDWDALEFECRVREAIQTWREESPQAFGSAGGYPLTCHQATGMMGAWTRPRLLHVRYKRIQMYGSISTGKLPSHQRDPVEGVASRSRLLRGHVKVGELRTQRPRANWRLKCQHGHQRG